MGEILMPAQSTLYGFVLFYYLSEYVAPESHVVYQFELTLALVVGICFCGGYCVHEVGEAGVEHLHVVAGCLDNSIYRSVGAESAAESVFLYSRIGWKDEAGISTQWYSRQLEQEDYEIDIHRISEEAVSRRTFTGCRFKLEFFTGKQIRVKNLNSFDSY